MNATKRIFVGTFVKNELLLKEYPKVKNTFENVVTGKWVEEWNLHFTYHFIGEVTLDVVDSIKKGLKVYLNEYQHELSFKGLGCFPNVKHPRVLFVNIIDGEGILKKIHNNCAQVLKKLGIEVDERPFHPHLTLLRIKSYKSSEFQERLQKLSAIDLGKIEKFKVELIESQLTKDGPIYKVI